MQGDAVSTWWQQQRLEDAVEVVHDAGIEAIDVDRSLFGFFRFDLQMDVAR